MFDGLDHPVVDVACRAFPLGVIYKAQSGVEDDRWTKRHVRIPPPPQLWRKRKKCGVCRGQA